MKKAISLLLTAALLICLSALVGCGSPAVSGGEYTRVAVDMSSDVGFADVSPSVELMVDDEGKVASATALNDDGAILLAGESLEGETPGEALKSVIEDAIDIGFIIKNVVTLDQNSINILVSGFTDYAKNLGIELIEKAKTTLAELDVPGKVEAAKDVTVAELRRMVTDCGLYTEEEVAAMGVGGLLGALAESRKYASPLMTDELRAAYKSTRDHEIALAESGAVASIIGGLGSAYASTHAAYTAAVEGYRAAVNAIDDFNYSTFVAADSTYQAAIKALNDAKASYVSIRSIIADLSAEDRAALEAELAAAEQTYLEAVATMDQISSTSASTLYTLTEELTKAEAKLNEIETTLFEHNIEEAIKSKAAEIDAAVNAAKDSFFADFEAKYKDDINNAVASLTATKKTVVEKINETEAAIKAAADSIGTKIDELCGDEIDYIKGALNSAKDKLWEELQKIPFPIP